MIIDVRTRIWDTMEQLGDMAEALRRRPGEPWQRPIATPEAHATAMKPVAEAFILGFESARLGASIPVARVAEHVSRQPDKFMGFAGIDPTCAEPDPVTALEQALDMGLVGVAVSPMAAGFHPADTRAMALFEACAHKGAPVIVEPGVAPARQAILEFGQPHLFDEVMRTFPNLRLVLSSLGHPWTEQALALIGKHPSVYGDISEFVLRPWQLYNALVLAHQQNVMPQLFFGSNFPFCTPEKAIVTVYSVNTLVQGTPLPNVPREQLRAMVERDVLKCLNLQRAGRASSGTALTESEPAGRQAEAPEASDTPTDAEKPTVVEDAARQ